MTRFHFEVKTSKVKLGVEIYLPINILNIFFLTDIKLGNPNELMTHVDFEVKISKFNVDAGHRNTNKHTIS
jgi:hypothetical protein